MDKYIRIRGARQHNLKNISLDIPRDKMVVITGLSGSGKSSLAFDTIYAEGQRRYMESLSSYARQFLGQMDKPNVDYIEGLSLLGGEPLEPKNQEGLLPLVKDIKEKFPDKNIWCYTGFDFEK